MGVFRQKDCLLALPFSLLIGVFLGLGRAFYADAEGVAQSEQLLWSPLGGQINFRSMQLWLSFPLYAVAAFLGILGFFALHDWLVHYFRTRRDGCQTKEMDSRIWFLLSLGLVVVLWAPALLAMWPGAFVSDGPLQLDRIVNHGYIDLHWPAAHTLVLYALFELGKAFFGSWSAGLTVYCLVQAAALAAALAYAAKKLVDWGLPRAYVMLGLLFVAANPVVQAYAFSTVKDALFSAFFLLTLVLFCGMARNDECLDVATRNYLLLIVSACLTCLLRKQGAYVLAIAVAVHFVMYRRTIGRRARAWLFGVALVPLVVALGFSSVVGLVFPVVPDSSRELLSVPSQQLARVYALDRESLTSQQVEVLGGFYDLNGLEDYIEPIADPAKGALNEASYAKEGLGYWRLWLEVGISHPGLYLESLLWGSIGYVYPTQYATNRWTGFPPWNEFSVELGSGEDSRLEQDSLLPGYYADYLMPGAENMFPGMPLLTLWVSPALPFWVLLGSLLVMVRNRVWRFLPVWLMAALYWGTLQLGPVMCNRYSLPLLFSSFFVFAIPYIQMRDAGRTSCSQLRAS